MKPFERSVVTLNMAPFLGPNGDLSAGSQSRLAAELIARLRTPPYWLILVVEHNPIDLGMLKRLLRTMGQNGQTPDGDPPRISSTKVCVDPAKAARKGNVTHYSRTPDALPLHTDCSNKVDPQNLAAFAMERPDPRGGGESVMLSAVDFIQELPGELVDQLRQPVFPFTEKRRFPILQGQGDELRIRYYRNQVTSAMDAQQTLQAELIPTLDELDRYLNSSRRCVRFHMQAGDVLMMDNQRVMHGRGAMPADSIRLMHRFRVSVPALAATR